MRATTLTHLSTLCCNVGGPLDDPDTAGTAEAEQAAADAHDRTDEPDDIMDALEAAEAKYDKAHPEEAAGPGALVILTIHVCSFVRAFIHSFILSFFLSLQMSLGNHDHLTYCVSHLAYKSILLLLAFDTVNILRLQMLEGWGGGGVG